MIGMVLRNRIFLAAMLLLLLAVVGRVTWARLGHLVQQDPRFRFSPEKLAVNEPPSWIHSDVQAAAFRVGDFEAASLLDRELVSEIENAFRLQTWVADVEQVRKSPQGVQVQLRYREPVAMVEIVTQGSPKLQPIDGEGVLLPGSEFSQSQAAEYLRIGVPHPRLNGLIDGTEWPDQRIRAAAAVAEVVHPYRDEVQLFRINLLLPGQGQQWNSPLFEIETHHGQRIIWGTAPESLEPESPEVALRLEALRSLKPAVAKPPQAGDRYIYDIRSGTAVLLAETYRGSVEREEGTRNPWELEQ